jgi:hypothetical protein
MTVRRLAVILTVALLCGCLLILAAGCGTPEGLSAPIVTATGAAPTATAQSTTTTAGQSTTAAEAARLYPVSVDGKWGFIDNTGSIKIEPRFDYAGDFSEGLAAVEIVTNDGAKSGYIDSSGAMVIEPRFDYAGDFSEGLAAVGNKTGLDGELGGEFGYINTSGVLVIPIERNTASAFSEGLAMFTVMGEGYPSYFIDKTGAAVMGPFDFALDFSEGLAYVEWGDRCGYIDKTGSRVMELPQGFGRCQHSSCCFSEGLALVEFSEKEVERHVFVDRSGAMVIAPRFDYAQDFSEGLAAAAIQESGELKWGYIDKTGAWVIKPRFDWAAGFSEGLAAVSVDGRWGYLNATGTMVIPPRQCTGAEPFSGGVAALTGLGSDAVSKTPSYIDKTGKVIWEGR